MTSEEFWELQDDRRTELVEGRVIELSPPGAEHGAVDGNLAIIIGGFIRSRGLGVVPILEAGFKIRSSPDTVRGPDLALVRRERVPAGGIPVKYWEISPDLVIEIISPGDRKAEVAERVRDWLETGTPEVWEVVPRRKEVHVHRCGEPTRTLRSGETITCQDLLPGFALSVDEIFRI